MSDVVAKESGIALTQPVELTNAELDTVAAGWMLTFTDSGFTYTTSAYTVTGSNGTITYDNTGQGGHTKYTFP